MTKSRLLLQDLQKDFDKLSTSSFTLQDNFLEAFFDPIPKGITKYILGLFLLFTLTNIFAAIVLLVYYLSGPRKTRLSKPKIASAKEWFLYAERCLKYNYTDQITEGYTKALELEPENGQILLRYNQFIASEYVHNKTPTTGQPVGIIKITHEKNPYETYKNLLQDWKESHYLELFPNPLNPSKKEKIFLLASWIAYDTKNYVDCIEFGLYSLEIKELTQSKKDRIEKIELFLLLSCASIALANQNQGTKFLIEALMQVHSTTKSLEAMVWELAGECFNQNKQQVLAEKCFLEAQKKDPNRWISAYRLFRYYTKLNDQRKSSYYKNRYIRVQKELAPL